MSRCYRFLTTTSSNAQRNGDAHRRHAQLQQSHLLLPIPLFSSLISASPVCLCVYQRTLLLPFLFCFILSLLINLISRDSVALVSSLAKGSRIVFLASVCPFETYIIAHNVFFHLLYFPFFCRTYFFINHWHRFTFSYCQLSFLDLLSFLLFFL